MATRMTIFAYEASMFLSFFLRLSLPQTGMPSSKKEKTKDVKKDPPDLTTESFLRLRKSTTSAEEWLRAKPQLRPLPPIFSNPPNEKLNGKRRVH